MTRTEIDSFYRETDVAERTGRPAWQIAADYAERALDVSRYPGALTSEFDSAIRVLARVAFRFADRYAHARDRTYNLTRGIVAQDARGRAQTERHQRAANAGLDTWDDYRGEK